MHSLLEAVEFSNIENVGSAGTGTTKADIVDMLGWDGVIFLFRLNTVVNDAVVTAKVADGDTNSTGDMAATVATSGAITSDGTTIALSNKMIVLEVVNPKERYLEAQLVVADQNATLGGITAIKYRGSQRPSVQPASVYFADSFVSPAAA